VKGGRSDRSFLIIWGGKELKELVILILAVLAYYFIIFDKRMPKSTITLFIGLILMASHLVKNMNVENLSEIVDFNTLGLLFGMMITVSILEETGLFQYLVVKMLRLSKANYIRTIVFLMMVVALTSAFLDNVITILMTAPMIFLVADTLGVNPTSLIFLTLFIDNIGGMATIIGSPLNIVLGSESGLSFNAFLKNLGTFAIFAFITVFVVFKRYLPKPENADEKLKLLAQMDPKKAITNLPLLKKSLPVFLVVLAGFSMHGILKTELSIISMLGALFILLLSNRKFEDVSKKIDWDTLFFYMGLYMITFSLEKAGFTDTIAKLFMPLKDHPFASSIVFLWISSIITPFLSAVPGTLLMVPVIHKLVSVGFTPYIWWAYGMGANLGTNLTPLGAVQNLIGVSLLEKNQGEKIEFTAFMKLGIKVVLPTMILATIWVSIRFMIWG